MTKITKLLTVFTLLISSVSFTGLAQNTQYGMSASEVGLSEDDFRVERLTEKKVEKSMQNCEEVVVKLDSLIEFYSNNNNNFDIRYSRISTKLKSLSTSLQEEKVDTTELDKATEEFEIITESFNVLSDSFLESLKQGQEYACGKTETEFLTQKKDFQNKVVVTNEKAGEARDFIENTLKPLIQNYK